MTERLPRLPPFVLPSARALFDKKAHNLLVLDAQGNGALAEIFMIAEGTSTRHVQALADVVEIEMAKWGRHPHYVEGRLHGDWIAMDYGDCIVHLFAPEQRQRYSFEQLWQACRLVSLPFWEEKSSLKRDSEV